MTAADQLEGLVAEGKAIHASGRDPHARSRGCDLGLGYHGL